MKPYFTSFSTVSIFPPVIQYPWEEPKEQVYERVWIMTDASMLEVEGNIYDISKDSMNLEGVVEIFKGWVQMIHLESLKPGKDAKTLAQKTLPMMELLLDQVKKEKGIDVFSIKPEDEITDIESKSFHQRALFNMIKHTLIRAVWF